LVVSDSSGQGQALNASDEVFRIAGGEAVAVLAEQGMDERDGELQPVRRKSAADRC
jgi:hypothetical protein